MKLIAQPCMCVPKWISRYRRHLESANVNSKDGNYFKEHLFPLIFVAGYQVHYHIRGSRV